MRERDKRNKENNFTHTTLPASVVEVDSSADVFVSNVTTFAPSDVAVVSRVETLSFSLATVVSSVVVLVSSVVTLPTSVTDVDSNAAVFVSNVLTLAASVVDVDSNAATPPTLDSSEVTLLSRGAKNGHIVKRVLASQVTPKMFLQ